MAIIRMGAIIGMGSLIGIGAHTVAAKTHSKGGLIRKKGPLLEEGR